MAGDWIKVEKTTLDKPEIRHIARYCGVSTEAAFAAWFRLWVYFDAQTSDGNIPLLTPEDCDDLSKLRGLGSALEECGWVTFHPRGATVMNWDRHNGQSAKRRAMETNRKRMNRAKA